MISVRENYVSIGELARKFQINTSALRYYEQIGLLSAAEKRHGVRYYGNEEAYRLAFIQLFTKTGLFRLEQIADLLKDTNPPRAFQSVLEGQLEKLDDQIAHARRARRLAEHFLKCNDEHLPHCPITRQILNEEVGGLNKAD